ncbi:MAG TPA: hypothetical protein DDW50_01440 [Firmicutes bacterium]|nr:hypothetical protein [Bacillota bacterium]
MKKALWIITIIVFGFVMVALVYVKIESPKMVAQYNKTSVVHKVINEKLSLKQLNGFLSLAEDEMRSRLGDPDQVIMTGPDLIYYGYVYSKLGITAIFGEETDKPLYIECSNRVSFLRVKSGMNFGQVQRKLGKSVIREQSEGIWVLSYKVRGLLVSFTSNFKNGKDSKLQVSNESTQPI